MFARLSIVQINLNNIEESGKLYKESVMPAMKKQKGYKGVYLLGDRKNGKSIAISLWESEEDAIANEKSGYYLEQLKKFKDVFTSQPIIEGYEVILNELKDW